MSEKPKETEKANEEQRDRQHEHLLAAAFGSQKYRDQEYTSPPTLHQVQNPLSSSAPEVGRTTSTSGLSLTNLGPSVMGSLSHLSSHQMQIQSNAALLHLRELQQKAVASVAPLPVLHQQSLVQLFDQEEKYLSHPLQRDDEEDVQQRKPQAIAKSDMPSMPLGFTPQTFVSNMSEDATSREEPVAKNSSITVRQPSVEYGDLKQYRDLLEKELDKVPATEKHAYTQAMVSCPAEVRDNEANLDWFLRREELNCQAAAKRIIKYWQLRLDTFDAKAFLPLHQTGEGALERKELTVLGTGFLNLLPTDSFGNPVLSMDVFRLKKSSSTDSIRRCMFYMFLLLAESEESQRPGATLLIMLNGPSLDKINISFLERLCDCLPIRFKAVHLLSFENASRNLVTKIQFGGEVLLHVAASKTELSQKLEPFGLQRSGLPKRFGGEWGFDKYVHWQELRTRMEWKIPFGLSGRGAEATSKNREFPDIVPYTQLCEEEKMERKRRMNVIHSRRKRDRERVEIDLLQEQIEELQEKKARLLQENQVLERLSQSANANFLSMRDAGGAARLPSVGATGGQSWQDYAGSNFVSQLAATGSRQQQQNSYPLNQFSLFCQNYPPLMGPSLLSYGQVQGGQADINHSYGNAADSESSSKPQSYASAPSATSPMRQLEAWLNPVELALLRAARLSPASSLSRGTNNATFSALPPPQVGDLSLNHNIVSSFLMQSAAHRSEEQKNSIEEDGQQKKAASP